MKWLVYIKYDGERRWSFLSPNLEIIYEYNDKCIWHEKWEYVFNKTFEDAKEWDYQFKIVKVGE